MTSLNAQMDIAPLVQPLVTSPDNNNNNNRSSNNNITNLETSNETTENRRTQWLPQCQCSERRFDLSLYAPLMSTIAFVVSAASTDWCDFAYRHVPESSSRERSGEFGMWAYQGWGKESSDCFWYPSGFEPDGWFRAARGSVEIGFVFGWVGMMVLLCSFCGPVSKGYWIFAGICLLMAGILQGLTLLVLKSSFCYETHDGVTGVECNISRGAVSSLIAMLIYLLSSVSVLRNNPPRDLF